VLAHAGGGVVRVLRPVVVARQPLLGVWVLGQKRRSESTSPADGSPVHHAHVQVCRREAVLGAEPVAAFGHGIYRA
jgi:hypothetical protein